MFEIARSRSASFGWLLGGALFSAFGILFLVAGNLPWAAVGLFLVIGVPLLGVSLAHLISGAPRLRATSAGIWFGGGRIVGWSEIRAIYESVLSVAVHGVTARPRAIAFEFHRRSTLFKLPFYSWFAAFERSTHVPVRSGNTSVVVAKLEAMRTIAVGHVDGVTAGDSELPSARVSSGS